MVYPDKIDVLINLLIQKGIIKDRDEWLEIYKEFMKNMPENRR